MTFFNTYLDNLILFLGGGGVLPNEIFMLYINRRKYPHIILFELRRSQQNFDKIITFKYAKTNQIFSTKSWLGFWEFPYLRGFILELKTYHTILHMYRTVSQFFFFNCTKFFIMLYSSSLINISNLIFVFGTVRLYRKYFI